MGVRFVPKDERKVMKIERKVMRRRTEPTVFRATDCAASSDSTSSLSSESSSESSESYEEEEGTHAFLSAQTFPFGCCCKSLLV